MRATRRPARQACRARRPRRRGRRQCRRQQGCGRSDRRLRGRRAGLRAACLLSDGQHLLAQHARPARPAGARASWPRCCRGGGAGGSASGAGVPIFLKIAPDLAAGDGGRRRRGDASGIDGSDRFQHDPVARRAEEPQGNEAGGLSGRPLFQRSTVMLARMRRLVGPKCRSSGSAASIRPRRRPRRSAAGADLVQLYTGA
jgi:hypothetical protein